MQQAAQAGNRDHAPAILAAITVAARPPAGVTTEKAPASSQLSVWEWEGGQLYDHEAVPDRSRSVPWVNPRACPSRGFTTWVLDPAWAGRASARRVAAAVPLSRPGR
jgi:hypothetical protein